MPRTVSVRVRLTPRLFLVSREPTHRPSVRRVVSHVADRTGQAGLGQSQRTLITKMQGDASLIWIRRYKGPMMLGRISALIE